VSGAGDGGLVDVFRLTIRDFRYERIFSEILGPPVDPLMEKLRALPDSQTQEEGWLFDQFSLIETEQAARVAQATSLLRNRVRSDTQVTLNGKEDSLRQSLTLNRVSLSNALLIYFLYRIRAVSYESGSIDASDAKNPKLNGASVPAWLTGAKLIVRHGTDRERALRDVGCADAIEFMRRQSKIRDSGRQIFPAGWWGRYTAPEDAANPGRPPAPIEFVPPALMTHATTFVSTLGNILEHLIDKKSAAGSGKREFRVTLHRLVRFDGREVFQQITPYLGSVENKAGLGRFLR
jgi:hypothetical protein